MHARHYALRRVNPYRGVIQTVDVGNAAAHSYDGVTWHLNADDGFGWVRPVGVWVEGEGLRSGVAGRHGELLDALRARPALPFKLADSLELWLLDRERGLPLALIDAVRPSRFTPARIEPEWQPFVRSYTAFRSPTLAQREGPGPHPVSEHKDILARMVNNAARPYARAQWFSRLPDGSGEGQDGTRLEPGWRGRILPAEDFPELLVRESWNSRLEQSVISDYHAWVAPFLLLLPNLSDSARDRLEAASSQRARWLLQVHRLIPKVIDAARFNATLVAARLESAEGEQEP